MNRIATLFTLAAILIIGCSPVISAELKEWTLAVYLNADNNLDPFGVEDQLEMSRIGSNEWLNMVTLIDRERGPASYNLIEKGKITKLQDLGEVDMGDYRQLVKFMKWVKENYPAKKYILTIWNHGSGWKQKNKGIVRGISYDDSSNNHITTEQLEIALREIKDILGKKLDILNFDACLMQMMEVVYVCKDYCNFVIASEEVEPGKGAPYDDIFTNLTKTSTPASFARTWVKAFCNSYNNGSQGYEACTQSAIACKTVNRLTDAVNGLAKALMSGGFAKEIQTALRQVQKFEFRENIDLIHFTKLIQGLIKDEGVQTACTKLLTAAKATVIENATVDSSMRNAFGIAIYFPISSYMFETNYRSLAFAKNTMWDEMIQDYYKKINSTSLISAVETGNTDAIRRYVAEAAGKNQEVNEYVVSKLKFRLHSEGGIDKSIANEIDSLLDELLQK